MHRYVSIAIDGPAASGKSSVGLNLAEKLGFIFLDTGIMYRAVTWAALEKCENLHDPEAISLLANSIQIEITTPTKKDGRINDVIVDGIDITRKIRDEKVNNSVSLVSTYSGVRNALTRQQRLIGKNRNIVMVGRDIGTVVMPDADYKFFLNASIEERARRRFSEEISQGGTPVFENVLENLHSRDKIDSSRDIAPLFPADNAIIIETDHKSLNEVVEEIVKNINLSK